MTNYWYDPINHCFWFKPESTSTHIDQIAAIRGMTQHPEFEPGISRVWDLTETELKNYRSSSAVKLMRKLKKFPVQLFPSKNAVIVNDDFGVGIVRMHMGWSDIDQLDVQIFFDHKGALDWLRALKVA